MSVRAGSSGTGIYADVIRGIGWVVANKASYGIRVLNLLFRFTPVGRARFTFDGRGWVRAEAVVGLSCEKRARGLPAPRRG